MTWNDVTREPKPATVRQFGVLCGGLLLAAAAHQFVARARPGLAALLGVAALACLALGLAVPRLFRWVFTGAMWVAFPIGFVVSQVLLAIVFFGVFLPVGLGLRATGWDAMLRRRGPAGGSYWHEKPAPADLRRYLRQY